MKRKIIALLAGAVLLCGITGCENTKGNVSAPESSTNSDTSSVEESSTAEPDSSTENSTDNSSEPSDSKVEFNFDEAVKNFTLFGNKIFIPCTISDFGNDFSLNEELYVPIFDEKEEMLCDLLYQGKKIGTVVMADCREGDDFNDKEIVVINLGFVWRGTYPYTEAEILSLERMNCYTGKIEHDFAGLSYDSTEEDIKSALGEPNTIYDFEDNYQWIWEYNCGYIWVVFNGSNHKIEQFMISVIN